MRSLCKMKNKRREEKLLNHSRGKNLISGLMNDVVLCLYPVIFFSRLCYGYEAKENICLYLSSNETSVEREKRYEKNYLKKKLHFKYSQGERERSSWVLIKNSRPERFHVFPRPKKKGIKRRRAVKERWLYERFMDFWAQITVN